MTTPNSNSNSSFAPSSTQLQLVIDIYKTLKKDQILLEYIKNDPDTHLSSRALDRITVQMKDHRNLSVLSSVLGGGNFSSLLPLVLGQIPKIFSTMAEIRDFRTTLEKEINMGFTIPDETTEIGSQISKMVMSQFLSSSGVDVRESSASTVIDSVSDSVQTPTTPVSTQITPIQTQTTPVQPPTTPVPTPATPVSRSKKRREKRKNKKAQQKSCKDEKVPIVLTETSSPSDAQSEIQPQSPTETSTETTASSNSSSTPPMSAFTELLTTSMNLFSQFQGGKKPKSKSIDKTVKQAKNLFSDMLPGVDLSPFLKLASNLGSELNPPN